MRKQSGFADLKLNAPYQTTVQGSNALGKLTHLVVTPPERQADVVDMSLSSNSSLQTGQRLVNE